MWHYTIVLSVFLLIAIVLMILLLHPRYKKVSTGIKIIEFLLLCLILCLCAFMVLPGTESNYESGKTKLSIKTPPKLYEYLGLKGQSLNAQNTDDKETREIILSYYSNHRIPDINFLEGGEYFNKLYESEDGTTVFYSANIPPGKAISAASASAVYVKPIDMEEIKKFFTIWQKETATKETKK